MPLVKRNLRIENKETYPTGTTAHEETGCGGCVSVTQSTKMRFPGLALVLALSSCLCPGGLGQQLEPVEFSVERPHPRLLLTARHQRLLRRECQRRTPRWLQLERLLASNTPLPEPGFARALHYIASGDARQGRKAIVWALTDGSDARQLALVFDWCHPLLSESEKRILVKKLNHILEASPPAGDFSGIRARLFAALAIAEENDDQTERELRRVVEHWWRGNMVPALRRGEHVIGRDQVYPLIEILHAIQDNLQADLRRDDPHYFTTLPQYLLLSYYPAVYPAAGTDYRIPVLARPGEPDPRAAALARAADMSLVAYDPNAVETQYLQGFSMRDQFVLHSAFGIPYEFLWANPYHPGLSYYGAPLRFHDPRDGRLLARSSWDDNAVWFYLEDNRMQSFTEGRIQWLNWDDLTDPIRLGSTLIEPLHDGKRFQVNAAEATTCYLIGLEPHARYDIEVDDEEIREEIADAGGTIVLQFPAGRKAGARLHLHSRP